MKYKPTMFPATVAAVKAENWGIALLAGVLETWMGATNFKAGAGLVFSCGNPKCGGSFALVSGAKRPLVCPKCGQEIDWTGIATRKVKRCPECKRLGKSDDIYCSYHVPPVALREEEVPL